MRQRTTGEHRVQLCQKLEAGSIKIRVETIDYFLKRCRDNLLRRKQVEAEIDARLGQYERWLRKAHGLPNAGQPGCERREIPATAGCAE
jgi:hypothetical protein